MDELDFFETVDLDEVSKKTLITKEYLTKLKNDDFKGIGKTKGLGFIKIIEREYKVDLSKKREKFLEYIQENESDQKKEYFIVQPKNEGKNFKKIFSIVLLLLIIIGVLYIIYINLNIFKTKNISYKPNNIVKEAKIIANIEFNNSDTKKSVNLIKEKNVSKNISYEENLSLKIDNNLSLKIGDKNVSKEKNSSIKAKVAKPKKTPLVNKKRIFVVEPMKKIWVGVIYLKNFKKKSYINDSNISVLIDGDTLLATGHGDFKLFDGNRTYNFSKQNSVRLYIKGGNVTQISRDQFIKLNRGKIW